MFDMPKAYPVEFRDDVVAVARKSESWIPAIVATGLVRRPQVKQRVVRWASPSLESFVVGCSADGRRRGDFSGRVV